MKLVERALCFECGDWVLARVNLPANGSAASRSLTCPACGATWTPSRPVTTDGTAAVTTDEGTVPEGFFTHVFVGHDHIRVAVGGDVDISTAVRFRDVALEALQEEPTRVIVDLTDVTFMDSTGLAALVLIRRRARTRDIRLSIVSTDRLNTLLHVSGLDQALETYPSLAAAEADDVR